MSIASRLTLLGAIVLGPLTVNVGCEKKEADEEWSPRISTSSPELNVALGGHGAKVGIQKNFVGRQQCDDSSSSCNAAHCWTPTKVARLESVGITCSDGATCTLAPESDPSLGYVHIDVASLRAGTVQGNATLRGVDGVVDEVPFSVEFVVPKGIQIVREASRSPHGLRSAALPGARFEWCASLIGNRANIQYDPVLLQARIEGPVTGVTRDETTTCDSFEATGPGDIAVTYVYGDLTRTEHVHVIDTRDVVSLDVAVVESDATWLGRLPLEEDPLADAPVAPSLHTTACVAAFVVPRMHTARGEIALGIPDRVRTEPSDLAHIFYFDEAGPPIAMSVEADSDGVGTLVLETPGARLDVPLTTAAKCAESDDDDPDAADAGAADAHDD